MSRWKRALMQVVQCLRGLSIFAPSQLRLKGFLLLIFTQIHPPLSSCRGVQQSGVMDH